MRHAILAFAALISFAACSTGSKSLPKPDGQVFRLNPDRWPSTVNDVAEAPVRSAGR